MDVHTCIYLYIRTYMGDSPYRQFMWYAFGRNWKGFEFEGAIPIELHEVEVMWIQISIHIAYTPRLYIKIPN